MSLFNHGLLNLWFIFIYFSLYKYSKYFAILLININGLYQRSSSMVI